MLRKSRRKINSLLATMGFQKWPKASRHLVMVIAFANCAWQRYVSMPLEIRPRSFGLVNLLLRNTFWWPQEERFEIKLCDKHKKGPFITEYSHWIDSQTKLNPLAYQTLTTYLTNVYWKHKGGEDIKTDKPQSLFLTNSQSTRGKCLNNQLRWHMVSATMQAVWIKDSCRAEET